MRHSANVRQIVGSGSIRRGVTVLESAIVLAVFLAMMLGVFDLGLAALRQNALDAAAREVVRAAVVKGAMAGQSQSAWGPARFNAWMSHASDMTAVARNKLITMEPQRVASIVDWPDGGHEIGDRVRARLAYRHRPIFPAVYGSRLDLRAECVMRIAH